MAPTLYNWKVFSRNVIFMIFFFYNKIIISSWVELFFKTVFYLRWSLLINFLLHTGHAKFFSPVCVLVWRASSSERANLFPQPSQLHGNGLSPITETSKFNGNLEKFICITFRVGISTQRFIILNKKNSKLANFFYYHMQNNINV